MLTVFSICHKSVCLHAGLNVDTSRRLQAGNHNGIRCEIVHHSSTGCEQVFDIRGSRAANAETITVYCKTLFLTCNDTKICKHLMFQTHTKFCPVNN